MVFLFIFCQIVFCSVDENELTETIIISDRQQYSDNELLGLEKIYSISIDNLDESYISNASWLQIDNDRNLYVLDHYEAKIYVYDENGNFIKSFGRPGQGPNELERPLIFFINNSQLYIYESAKGIKIWDFDGKYIDYIIQQGSFNFATPVPIDDFLLIINYGRKDERGRMISEIAKYTKDFKLINHIVSIAVDQKKDPGFIPGLISFNNKNQFYWPQERNKYIINKYDFDGNVLLSFGRKYERKPYSDNYRSWYAERNASLIERGLRPKLPTYPPIVRYIITDDKGYIWVALGEWYYDSEGLFQLNVTFDIFDENANFLYTFEHEEIGQSTIIKDGRLYSLPTNINDTTIDVYKITYNY